MDNVFDLIVLVQLIILFPSYSPLFSLLEYVRLELCSLFLFVVNERCFSITVICCHAL